MIQGNPEITSCEDKSIHGSINPFPKRKREKKEGLMKRVQKNGHPSSRQGDSVLEHLGLARVCVDITDRPGTEKLVVAVQTVEKLI